MQPWIQQEFAELMKVAGGYWAAMKMIGGD